MGSRQWAVGKNAAQGYGVQECDATAVEQAFWCRLPKRNPAEAGLQTLNFEL